ncbi:MAG: hypothetical protein AAF962_05105 [Actinomycetota bacterium]
MSTTEQVLSVSSVTARFDTQDGVALAADGVRFDPCGRDVSGVAGDRGSGRGFALVELVGAVPALVDAAPAGGSAAVRPPSADRLRPEVPAPLPWRLIDDLLNCPVAPEFGASEASDRRRPASPRRAVRHIAEE